MSNLEDDPEFKAWAERIEAEVENSALNISVCTFAGKVGVRFAAELGLSIMLDKPIIAVVQAGRPLPERLVRVADEIVEMQAGELMTDPVAKAIERVGRRLGKRERR